MLSLNTVLFALCLSQNIQDHDLKGYDIGKGRIQDICIKKCSTMLCLSARTIQWKISCFLCLPSLLMFSDFTSLEQEVYTFKLFLFLSAHHCGTNGKKLYHSPSASHYIFTASIRDWKDQQHLYLYKVNVYADIQSMFQLCNFAVLLSILRC